MIEIEVIDREDRWDALQAAWDELAAEGDQDHPFRRFLWNRTWWKHYADGRRLAIVAARENDRWLGFAPLFLERVGWPTRRSLRWLASSDNICSEYLGPIVRRGCQRQVTQAMFDYLFGRWRRVWHMLRLSDLPADGAEAACIEDYLTERGLPYARRPGPANWIVHLAGTWEAYLAQSSYKARKKARWALREFERHRLTLELADPQTFDARWEDLRRLHNLHWSAAGRAGLFAQPRFEAFHREVAREYCRRGQLLLASLVRDGTAIASSYTIRQGDTAYEYQRGHDPAELALQPGHLLQFSLFRAAIAQGVRTWDYLRGDYRHKRDAATGRRATTTFTIPAPRLLAVQQFRLEQVFHAARTRLSAIRHGNANAAPAEEPDASPAPA